MARKELAALLGFLVIVGPLTYFIAKEEIKQSKDLRKIHRRSSDVEIEDAISGKNLKISNFKSIE